MKNLTKITVALALLVAASSCSTPEEITYASVAGLPREERLARMALASPEEMATMFHAHLEHVAAGPDVMPADREALARVGVLLSAEWYVAEPSERDPAIEAEAGRLARGLTYSTARAMMSLGGEGP